MYIKQQNTIIGLPLMEVLQNTFQDPGYELMAWLSGSIGLGIYGSNFICGLLFGIGLISFCMALPRPWLALALSVPYLDIVVAMGYTRQSVAIAFVMLAIISLEKRQLRKFFVYIAMACLFHKTAVIAAGLAFPQIISSGKIESRILLLLLSTLIAGALAYTFLAPRLDFYNYGYEQQAMQSQGAGIRVAMIILPASIFIIFGKKFGVSSVQKVIWLGLSYSAVACLFLLLVLKSSTVVDRLALYCIPLQMFVGSRLADLRLTSLPNRYVSVMVVFCAALVQYAWLNFAATAFAWIPYQNILLSN